MRTKRIHRESQRTVGHVLRLAALCTVCAVLAGCVNSFGTLEGVVKDDHAATVDELRDIQVVRSGRLVPAELNMVLRKDDEIITAEGTRAVLLLMDGAYEVTLGPDTEIQLKNPSVFVRIGQVVYEKLKEIRERLEIESEMTTAGAEGTEFLFAVDAENVVKIAVREGAVHVAPKEEGLWEPVIYGASQQGVVRGAQPPERMPDLSPEDVRELFAWAGEVEAITTIEIPRLAGLTEQEARQELEEIRLGVGRVRYEVTGNARGGTVIRQDPVAGETQRMGDPVNLWVERESVLIPDLTNRSLEEAQQVLREAGLRVGRVTEEVHEGSRGGVIGQSPRAGRRVDRGTEVRLEVAVPGARVPDLRGSTRLVAERRLRSLGLRVGQISERPSRMNAGTVIEHRPGEGTLLQTGIAVDLVLASECVVPNLAQLSERQAIERIRDAELDVGVVTPIGTGNVVSQQQPEAGRQVECGSAVDIWVGVIQ